MVQCENGSINIAIQFKNKKESQNDEHQILILSKNTHRNEKHSRYLRDLQNYFPTISVMVRRKKCKNKKAPSAKLILYVTQVTKHAKK